MSKSGASCSTLVTTGLFCFAAGAFAGIVWMNSAGYKLKTTEPAITVESEYFRPRFGSAPPNSALAKNQLAMLVVKLDQLTGKPLAIELDEEQRAKIRDELEGIDEFLTEEMAKQKLRNVLQIVENDRATLSAAGYRWPGLGPPPSNHTNNPFSKPGLPDASSPEFNPFHADRYANHLRSLLDRLTDREPN